MLDQGLAPARPDVNKESRFAEGNARGENIGLGLETSRLVQLYPRSGPYTAQGQGGSCPPSKAKKIPKSTETCTAVFSYFLLLNTYCMPPLNFGLCTAM